MNPRLLPAAAALLALAACGTTDTSGAATSTTGTAGASAAAGTGQCGKLTTSDAWVKAADTGMTGGFASLRNTGSTAAHIVSATSPASAMMELHETVASPQGGTMMRAKEGGFTIEPGGTLSLAPGGNHIMFMKLTGPLQSGTTTSWTLACQDGSTLAVTAQVRTFTGAKETYVPGATTGTGSMPGMTGGMTSSRAMTSHG